MRLFEGAKERIGRIRISLACYGKDGVPFPVKEESAGGQNGIVLCGTDSAIRDELVLDVYKRQGGHRTAESFGENRRIFSGDRLARYNGEAGGKTPRACGIL